MDVTALFKLWGIAITGGVASGKSTVGAYLRSRGQVVVDADQVSRTIVLPGTEGFREIVAAFGSGILTRDGMMDRAKMREIVFASPDQRRLLETIIHSRLAAATVDILANEALWQNPRLWFYEASLIYERDRAGDFREVWVAYCPREMQISRLMARDHCDRAQAEAILAAQMPSEEKARRADRLIETDCDREEMDQRIDRALETLINDSADRG